MQVAGRPRQGECGGTGVDDGGRELGELLEHQGAARVALALVGIDAPQARRLAGHHERPEPQHAGAAGAGEHQVRGARADERVDRLAGQRAGGGDHGDVAAGGHRSHPGPSQQVGERVEVEPSAQQADPPPLARWRPLLAQQAGH